MITKVTDKFKQSYIYSYKVLFSKMLKQLHYMEINDNNN